MQPFYYLSKNINAKMLSGALVVLALALFIPFSTYLTQQRVSTTPQAGSQVKVQETSITLTRHQFDCSKGDPQNGVKAEANCNQISPGKIFAVDVQVRSDIDAANLVSVRLNYKNNLIAVEKIVTKATSSNESTNGQPKIAGDFFINSWINQKYNNEQGSLQLIGAVPTPGFITMKNNPPATMARIYFKALATGQSNVTIDDSATIFRNADNVNILKDTRDVSITVK